MEGKKTARQRFLRRTRALTLTISIPSMLATDQKTASTKEKSGSVVNLKRSQSSRDVCRRARSSSEQCLSREEEVLGLQPGSLADMREDQQQEHEGFGFRLKRSLTVSHIIDNFNKSFRVKRSQSQREVGPRRSKARYH